MADETAHAGASSRRHRAPRAGGFEPVSRVPCLGVLGGVAAALPVARREPRYAGWGDGISGCSLLLAALARLALAPRYVGLLSSRRKVSDVLAFTVLGAGVLVLALLLP